MRAFQSRLGKRLGINSLILHDGCKRKESFKEVENIDMCFWLLISLNNHRYVKKKIVV